MLDSWIFIVKRTKKTVGSTVTNYRWAGDMLMSEKTGSDTICYHYDTTGDLIAFSLNGTKYLYLKNLQNDIIGITDLAGNIKVEYTYDSWEKILSVTYYN